MYIVWYKATGSDLQKHKFPNSFLIYWEEEIMVQIKFQQIRTKFEQNFTINRKKYWKVEDDDCDDDNCN